LNFALWRITTWGPYPKACISFSLEGTERVALLFEKHPSLQPGFSHKIKYVTAGDNGGSEDAIADEKLSSMRLRGHDLEINYKVLRKPEEK